MNDEIIKIPLAEIAEYGSEPELEPMIDDIFIDLMLKSLRGHIKSYLATVPLNLIIPFDTEHNPESHRVGRQFLEEMTNDLMNGKTKSVMLYQKGRWFVLSDHYYELFAAINCDLPTLDALIFGEFENSKVKIMKGPLNIEEVKQCFRM